MKDEKRAQKEQGEESSSEKPVKRPYVTPAIEEEAVFETLAAGCTFNVASCARGGGSLEDSA